MRKRFSRLREKATHMLELPAEVTLDLPKIVLTGNTGMTIENHKGIVEYRPERVRMATTIGLLVVDGKDLSVDDVGKEIILVQGEVRSLTFVP